MWDALLRRILPSVVLLVISISAQAQLRVVKPNGGEIIYTNRDTTVTIEWTGIEDTLAVEIYVSSDNGTTWGIIADSAKGLSYTWNIVGRPTSSGYLVRVQQVRPPQPADNVIYTRHFSTVVDGAWSPSGTRVVTAGADPHVWNPDDGSAITVLSGHTDAVNTIDWSSDSLRIISASDDNTVRLWDATTYDPIRSYAHSGSVVEARFDPTGQFIASIARDERARVFSVNSGTATSTLSHPFPINDVAWSPASDRFTTCSDDNLVRLYNRTGGLPTLLNGHTQAGATSSTFSPSGTMLASLGGDATVRLWNLTTGNQIDQLTDPREGPRSAAFSPDGAMLAVGMSDSTVVVWDVATRTRIVTFGGHTNSVTDVAWSRDGTMLASASNDASVQIFDITERKRIRRLPHPSPVYVVRWSPDDARILTTAVDAARVWRVRNVVLQADTSDATFSITLPPPAVARLRTTGDTVMIGDRFPVELRLESTSFIDLADIDSIAVTISYNYTIIDLETTNVVAFERDSADVRLVTLKPVSLPLTDAILGVFTYRATLGTDSLTRVRVMSVRQIGIGAGVAFDTVTAPILIRGICREGDGPRLYNPIGGPLAIRAMRQGASVDIDVQLAEDGITTITVVDLLGRMLLRDVATPEEVRLRTLRRTLDVSMLGTGPYVVIVTTPTDRATVMVGAR